ncbi:hypothetical protein SAMN05216178_3180 [Pseudomonas saponiphila]|uniref:DUF1963 domain-containing protein n=1 Tax=Pseudomonas saponiphila TaxID=556534 RepID=A0A1H4P8C7_9PSED|nr:hypothetical protein [Pseudomonas saponiphila]SEC03202.1 hypothetical protein SAMN05216178_3180 [Pseudomonas saponiphila]
MFDELIFTGGTPAKDDAYVGGGACLPTDLAWPCSPDGVPLTHLMAFPGRWFSGALIDRNYWVSVFVPYQPGEVAHYRKLRAIDGRSQAVVMGYVRAGSERDEAAQPISDRGTVRLEVNCDADDDENLASKLDGVDAWLQSPVSVGAGCRRVSIYGGDLDRALTEHKGVLSDGMGYLFLDESFSERTGAGIGRFFLQLG